MLICLRCLACFFIFFSEAYSRSVFGHFSLFSLMALPTVFPCLALSCLPGADVPMPYAIPLEKLALPQQEDIAAAVRRAVSRKL